jgi:hypothetical protein
MSAATPLLSGTIEADEEIDAGPSHGLSGNIGESTKKKKSPEREAEVLVPGAAPRDVEEGGIVSN